MGDSSLTRRQLLRRGAVAGLSTAVTATAGCAEGLPPLGQRVQYGRVDAPAPTTESDGAAPSYRRWMPAASALPTDDLDPGFVNYTTPSNLGVNTIGFNNREPHFFQKPYLDYIGVPYDDLTQVIGMHNLDTTYVLTGTFDAETVGETLTRSGYTDAGTYSDYEMYMRKDGPRTAAVRSNAVVWARHKESRALVEAVIDASTGDADRHHETDTAFAAATDVIGAQPWVFSGLGLDPTGDALYTALSYTFDAENVYHVLTTLYPDAGTVSKQDIRDALSENTSALNAWGVDIQLRGRVSTVEIGMNPENRPNQYAGVTVPVITWSVTETPDGVAVRHEAGNITPADSIMLYTRTEGSRTMAETQFSDAVEAITPGDTVTVNVPSTADELVGEFSPPGQARAAQFPLYTRS